MNKEQQELYDKLLKKVNEYCLGQAAEDVIAAIDALVDDYEEDISFATLYSDVFAIIKKHRLDMDWFLQFVKYDLSYKRYVDCVEAAPNKFSKRFLLSEQEYNLLKEVL